MKFLNIWELSTKQTILSIIRENIIVQRPISKDVSVGSGISDMSKISSDLRNMMFENMTPLSAMGLKRKILEVIARYEPRVSVTQILVEPYIETISYLCEIDFTILGIKTPQKVRTSLDRAQ